MDPVTYERRGAAAVLTIDRQQRRNAIDGPTAELIAEGYDRFVADDDARVLVITGAGGVAFSAGADLKAIESFAPRMDDPRGPLGISRVISPKPTIAAISGWCLAGGLELALWCDLRIATDESALGFPERRWGVPLVDGGTQRMPRIIGLGRALDLILTGREIDAQEALAIGLVNEVVPDPLARALELAEAIAAFPQDTMLSDREATIAAGGLALEARLGRGRIATALEGAQRFRVRP
jgi:enoyl-CoA hydratase